jgi:peptide/nickel transport system substrate-binding protein
MPHSLSKALPGAPPPIETSSPQDPAILRIGTTDLVQSANILLDANLSLFAHVSNPTLMKMNQQIEPEGQLVETIEPSVDLKTWTLTLKDGLFWSDGRPVTAADVLFTFNYLRDKFPAAGWIKSTVSEISILDRNTLVIRINRPYGRLGFEFTTYPLLPQHIWEKIENPLRHTNSGHIVGCGPFVIDRTDLNRGVVSMVQNPHWKGPESQIDGVEIHLYKNRDVLALALEREDIDIFYEYASSYPYANLNRLRGSDRFGFLEQLNLGLYFLGFNLKKPPMSDPLFRRAVARALDYAEILRLILLDNGLKPQLGFIPPSMPAFKSTPDCSLDRKEAARLLDEAGCLDRNQDGIRDRPGGKDLRLTLLVDPHKPFNARLSELVEEYLRAVGIRITIKAVEGSSWVSLKDRYAYDLVLSRTSPWGMLMHASWATGYFDARRTGEGVLHTVDDPKFLALCDDLLAETDPGRIRSLAHRIQDYYAENLPAVALLWNKIITPYNQDYYGWELDPLYGLFNIDTLLNVRRKQP